jgi:hypothetical protein
MEEYVTKDFLRAELSEIRAEIRGEMTQIRLEMSQLSERLTRQMNGMFIKTTLTLLIPMIIMIIGLFFKK